MPGVKKRSGSGFKKKHAAIPMLPVRVGYLHAELRGDRLPQMITFAPLARAAYRIPAEPAEPSVICRKRNRPPFLAEDFLNVVTHCNHVTVDVAALTRYFPEYAINACL